MADKYNYTVFEKKYICIYVKSLSLMSFIDFFVAVALMCYHSCIHVGLHI